MTKFCPKCNYGTPQLDVLIKFCSNCGYNFISASMPIIQIEPVQTRPKRIIAHQTIEEEIEEENNNNYPSEFDPPTIEIEDIPGRPQIKAEQLIFDKSPKQELNRPKLKKLNKKQIEEDFRNELAKAQSKEIGL